VFTNSDSLQVSKLIRYSSWIIKKSIELVKKEKLRRLPQDLEKNQDVFLEKLFLNISRNQPVFAEILFNLFQSHIRQKIQFKFENILITTPTNKIISNHKPDSDWQHEYKNGLSYKILNGIVIHSEAANGSIINETLNCLFINASLRSDYVHLGFNKNLQCNAFRDGIGHSESMPFWLNWQNKLKQILIANQIKAVFVRDQIEKRLIEFFQSNSILYFSNLPKQLNKHLKLMFKCEPLVFIEDFSEQNVFKAKCEQLTFNQQSYLVFNSPIQNIDSSSRFVALILESKLASTQKMNKEFLLHCLKRAENVLRTRCYIDESIELYLSEVLGNSSSLYDLQDTNKFRDDDVVYTELIKQALLNVFKDFYLIVRSNQPDYDNSFYDDFEGKINAWLFAFETIKTLQNADVSISY
jgi:hypothetical protein